MLAVLLGGGLAFAGDCAPVPLSEVTLAAADATGLAIRGVTGRIEVVADDGDTVRASGSACAAGARIKLTRSEDALALTVKVPRGVEGLSLAIVVPRSLAALTVEGQTGPLRIAGVPARLAVVNASGEVTVRDAGSLRVAYSTGAVTADALTGTLLLDHVVGRVDARAVRGDVVAEQVTGEITIAEVQGDLVVEGGTARVQHSAVHGRVDLL